MSATCTVLVLLAAVSRLSCHPSEGTTTTEVESTTTTEVESSTAASTYGTTTEWGNVGSRGLYGGSYYNGDLTNPNNIHYVHGTYQSPKRDYYKSQNYFREDDADETFDYYLGFGLRKMTDKDFQYEDFHYYYHDLNRNISNNETIPSDVVVACHPNATFFCPENTETVCLLNGTIYCMSKISVVVPCPFESDNETLGCVNTTVPCVRACVSMANSFERISLPCLATVVVVDVYELNNGKTISRVGGTFVLVDALTEAERTFCVTVIVDPKPKQTGH